MRAGCVEESSGKYGVRKADLSCKRGEFPIGQHVPKLSVPADASLPPVFRRAPSRFKSGFLYIATKPRARMSSAHDPGFEQHLIDHGISRRTSR